jgi:hypothetical protein
VTGGGGSAVTVNASLAARPAVGTVQAP